MGLSAARRRRSARAVLAAAVLFACVSGARAADDAAARVQSVIDALRSGDAAAAVARLGDEAAAAGLAVRTDLVYVLCDRAYRYTPKAADPAPRRALAERVLALATETAKAAAADDDRARWALAEALVVRERAGPPTGADSWNRAADLLQDVHQRRPDDTLPLVYAVSFLLEGACADADAANRLAERADAVGKVALDRQKDSPTVAVSIASSHLWAARTLLASNKKLARDRVRASLDALRRHATKPAPVVEVGTAWNDAVTLARTTGFVLPEKYVTTERTTLSGTLALEIPLSARWTFTTVPASGDQVPYDYVTQTTDDGKRLRQVLFRRYVWGQSYTFEGTNAVGGDNVKSIAQGLQSMITARVLAAGATTEAPARKPFNREFDGFVFEARGRTPAEASAPSEALRVTGYVMRGHDQACYAVLVYQYGADAGPSPEVEALVASLAEPGK